jgi:hypothetical protein
MDEGAFRKGHRKRVAIASRKRRHATGGGSFQKTRFRASDGGKKFWHMARAAHTQPNAVVLVPGRKSPLRGEAPIQRKADGVFFIDNFC